MILRTLVLALYVAVLAAAFAVQLLVPSLSVFVFYGLLFWLIASFFVFRLPGMSRPVPGTGGPTTPAPGVRSPASAGGAPLPSTPLSLGFCAFCGRDLPVGSSVCPACGHVVRAF